MVGEVDPPDGGCKVTNMRLWYRVVIILFQAWFIMICSFLVNGIVFSIINTFGILFVKLKADLEESGDEDAAFKCGTEIDSDE